MRNELTYTLLMVAFVVVLLIGCGGCGDNPEPPISVPCPEVADTISIPDEVIAEPVTLSGGVRGWGEEASWHIDVRYNTKPVYVVDARGVTNVFEPPTCDITAPQQRANDEELEALPNAMNANMDVTFLTGEQSVANESMTFLTSNKTMAVEWSGTTRTIRTRMDGYTLNDRREIGFRSDGVVVWREWKGSAK